MINKKPLATLQAAYIGMQHLSGAVQLTSMECAVVLHALAGYDAPSAIGEVASGQALYMVRRMSVAKGDLAQVFALLAALWRYDASLVDGDTLAQAMRRLMENEQAPGGPYLHNGKIDENANAHIALFMHVAAKPLPVVQQLLYKSLAQHRLPQETLFCLAAAYPSIRSLPLAIAHQNKNVIMEAAASLVTKKGVSALVRHLAATQQDDGTWHAPSYPAFVATAAGAGSIAALVARQRRAIHTRQARQALRAAKNVFADCSQPSREVALSMVDRIQRADTKFEITRLPWIFAGSMRQPPRIAAVQFWQLAAASICGWLAYTIYDDFIDEEGSPIALPTANIAMRAAVSLFGEGAGDASFGGYVQYALNDMDQANAWEVQFCRFAIKDGAIVIGSMPRYGRALQLARRSAGHVLVPMAILSAAGVLPNSARGRAMRKALDHYLIARQLSDDLHDWQQDVSAGRISFAVAAIMRSVHVKSGNYQLAQFLPAMQRHFRQNTLACLAGIVVSHVQEARHCSRKTGLLTETNEWYGLLDHLQRAARASLDRHHKAESFYARMAE